MSIHTKRLSQDYTVKTIHDEYPWSKRTSSKGSSMKLCSLSTPALMSPKFHKFKLLLDENMSARRKYASLNRLFDVKHIAFDLKKGGIRDKLLYREGVKLQRLIVTFNGDDFKPFVPRSSATGIIFVSDNLSTNQIDAKLVALLVRSSPNSLYGTFTTITGETKI